MDILEIIPQTANMSGDQMSLPQAENFQTQFGNKSVGGQSPERNAAQNR